MSLLTIAVPTYNRLIYLELCLQRLHEEIAALSENQRRLVKIYVSDNASPDDTPQLISRYQKTALAQFEAVRNEVNIGAEGNVAQCYTSATTPYVWVLGDDDLIVPNGLQKVLEVLQKQNPDILYVNNYWFMDDYSQQPEPPQKQGVYQFEEPLEFARRTNVMLTFISALIARTGIDLASTAHVVNGSNLPQLGWLLPLLRTGRNFAVIEDFIVAAKGSNSGGYELVKVFGYSLKKITDSILKDRPSLAQTIQNGTIVNFFPGFIVAFRKDANLFDDQEMVTGLREVFGANWRYYIFLWALFVLPVATLDSYNFLLRVFRRFCRRILV